MIDSGVGANRKGYGACNQEEVTGTAHVAGHLGAEELQAGYRGSGHTRPLRPRGGAGRDGIIVLDGAGYHTLPLAVSEPKPPRKHNPRTGLIRGPRLDRACLRSPEGQKGPMGLVVRTIGLARARVRIGLINLAYNMRRMVWLAGAAPA